jgi:hypothetical protein
MPFRCIAPCVGSGRLNIREQSEQFANEQWLPVHATMEEATEIVLDQLHKSIIAYLDFVRNMVRRPTSQTANRISRFAIHWAISPSTTPKTA